MQTKIKLLKDWFKEAEKKFKEGEGQLHKIKKSKDKKRHALRRGELIEDI